jgi:hypothetical protein
VNIITRQEAKAKELTRYFTGKPCVHGHVAERLVKNKTCLTCSAISAAKAKAKNPQKYYAHAKAWNSRNPEKIMASQIRRNRENPARRNLWTANYRQAKDSRMPAWLNSGQLAEMEGVYDYCSALRRAGLDYHVDHIVPLRGKIVSGLHVPWNLQVIPGLENVRKGNRFDG